MKNDSEPKAWSRFFRTRVKDFIPLKRRHRSHKNAAVPGTQKTAWKQIYLRRWHVGLRSLRTKEAISFIFDNDANFLYNIMT